MTKEEAINYLKFDGCTDCTRQPSSAYVCDCEECTYKQAVMLAIEALQLSIEIDSLASCIGTRDYSVPEKHSHCIRCGRVLKNPKAQERGYGEICWQKHLSDNQQAFF